MNKIYYQDEIASYGDFSPVLQTIGNNGCLAMCYLYSMGIEPINASSMAKYIRDLMHKGFLDSECFVLDANRLIKYLSGRVVTVQKKEITDIKSIEGPTPVRYDYNGKSHWVVVEDGKIVFNSLLNSTCVAKGKPTSARIIHFV